MIMLVYCSACINYYCAIIAIVLFYVYTLVTVLCYALCMTFMTAILLFLLLCYSASFAIILFYMRISFDVNPAIMLLALDLWAAIISEDCNLHLFRNGLCHTPCVR